MEVGLGVHEERHVGKTGSMKTGIVQWVLVAMSFVRPGCWSRSVVWARGTIS